MTQQQTGYEQQAPQKKRMSGKVKMAIGVTASLLVGVAIGASGQSGSEVVDDEQIKELSAQVDELEAQVDDLESERDGLNDEIIALEADNETLRTQAAEIDTTADVEDFTDSDEFNQLVFDLTWAETPWEEKASICWGVDVLGESEIVKIWDGTSGISGEDVYPMFIEACSAEGLL